MSAFAAYLATVWDVPESEAERLLERVSQIIARRLDADGEVPVPGLGVLRQSAAGVAFEPEDSLVAQVNVAYAGLPSLVLSPAITAPVGGETDEVEDPFAHVEGSIGDGGDHFDAGGLGNPVRDLNSVEPSPPDEEAHEVDLPTDDSSTDPETEPSSPLAEEGDATSPYEIAGRIAPQEEPPLQPTATEEDLTGVRDSRADDSRDQEEDFPVLEGGVGDPEKVADDHADDFGDPHDDLDDLVEGVWTPRMDRPGEEHPLGPPPREILEEADYQVVSPGKPSHESSPSRPPEGARAGEGSGGAAPPKRTEERKRAPQPPPIPPRGAPPQRSASPHAAPDRPAARSPAFEATRSAEPARSGARDMWPIFVIVALILMATAGLAYWTLWGQAPSPGPDVAEAPPPAPAPDEPLAAPPDDEFAVEEAPPAAPARDSRLYSAEGVDPAQGGFTWVISMPSATQAQQRASQYRDAGYRVSVLPATVRGTTFYRLAIGQFETRAAAERFREELPEDVPQDTWILAL